MMRWLSHRLGDVNPLPPRPPPYRVPSQTCHLRPARHVQISNLDLAIPRQVKTCSQYSRNCRQVGLCIRLKFVLVGNIHYILFGSLNCVTGPKAARITLPFPFFLFSSPEALFPVNSRRETKHPRKELDLKWGLS